MARVAVPFGRPVRGTAYTYGWYSSRSIYLTASSTTRSATSGDAFTNRYLWIAFNCRVARDDVTTAY